MKFVLLSGVLLLASLPFLPLDATDHVHSSKIQVHEVVQDCEKIPEEHCSLFLSLIQNYEVGLAYFHLDSNHVHQLVVYCEVDLNYPLHDVENVAVVDRFVLH